MTPRDSVPSRSPDGLDCNVCHSWIEPAILRAKLVRALAPYKDYPEVKEEWDGICRLKRIIHAESEDKKYRLRRENVA